MTTSCLLKRGLAGLLAAGVSLPVGAAAYSDDRPIAPASAVHAEAVLTTDDAGIDAPYGCTGQVGRPRVGTQGRVSVRLTTDCAQAAEIRVRATLYKRVSWGWKEIATGARTVTAREVSFAVREPCEPGTSTRYRGVARFTVTGPAGWGGASIYNESLHRIAC
jgi:hypothetical protein